MNALYVFGALLGFLVVLVFFLVYSCQNSRGES